MTSGDSHQRTSHGTNRERPLVPLLRAPLLQSHVCRLFFSPPRSNSNCAHTPPLWPTGVPQLLPRHSGDMETENRVQQPHLGGPFPFSPPHPGYTPLMSAL